MVRSASGRKPAPWHAGFLKLLPAIVLHARVSFRHQDPEAKAEAIQNCIANATIAYARLYELGKVELAYPGPLARYAVAQTRQGRIVGTALNAQDVSSAYAPARKQIVVKRLDTYVPMENTWREAVIEDTRSSPVPDTVAFRVDFAHWLSRLSRRDRRVARFLALGHRTLDAARKFNVTQGRIAQLRRELAASWTAFREDAGSVARVDPVAA